LKGKGLQSQKIIQNFKAAAMKNKFVRTVAKFIGLVVVMAVGPIPYPLNICRQHRD
jgi:hypothetical protein